ncbi:hypothetical protein FOA52_006529 [Chlamydomonas sp. UWO 241]|nr:hypothetical protein FOA52_006529 [Chlamydomonas sp. UWO 241]
MHLKPEVKKDSWKASSDVAEQCCFAAGVPVASQLKPPENMAFLIGAQKSGTTLLFHELTSRHPHIAAPQTLDIATNTSRTVKEPHYFDKVPLGSFDAYLGMLGGQGDDDARTTWLDATPENLLIPSAPCRIAAAFPRAKLIVVLKDPVQRALSAWNMARHKEAKNTRTFAEQVADEIALLRNINCSFEAPTEEGGHARAAAAASSSSSSTAPPIITGATGAWQRAPGLPSWNDCFRCSFSYCGSYTGPKWGNVCASLNGSPLGSSTVRRGLYAYQLEWWLAHFLPSQLLVINSDQLGESTYEATLDKIIVFLGLDPKLKLPADWRAVKKHKFSLPYDGEVDVNVLRSLHAFYAHANSELYKLLASIGPGIGWSGTFPTKPCA